MGSLFGGPLRVRYREASQVASQDNLGFCPAPTWPSNIALFVEDLLDLQPVPLFNDGRVMSLHEVLRFLPVVFHALVGEKVDGDRLLA